MKRGYQESSSSGSLRPPQSKIRHNPEGDAHFLEDESTKVFARKVADHYSARMNQTLEEQGASPIIHLKKLNNCIESVLIQLYAHRGDAVLDLACGKLPGLSTFRSMKHCTIPREPKFHKPPQHKNIKCGMICSHTNSEMQRRKKNQDFS